MNAAALLAGAAVLGIGGLVLAATRKKTVTLNQGAAYSWTDSRPYSALDKMSQYMSLGFASVTTDGNAVQGVWSFPARVWELPDGVSDFQFHGYITEQATKATRTVV